MSPPALPAAGCPTKEAPGRGSGSSTTNNNNALVALPSPSSSPSPPLRSLAARRADREAHTHATVWTKDPHGGPHAPADVGGAGEAARRSAAATHAARLGGEALAGPRPLPGSAPPAEAGLPLGYARPAPPGPTTNFVGDAMVGTAAGLVGARLAAANAAAVAGAVGGRPPLPGPVRLLAGQGGGAPAPTVSRALAPAPCTPGELRDQALALMAAVEGWGGGVGVGRLEGG